MASTFYTSSGKEVFDGDLVLADDLNSINTAVDSGFQLVEAVTDSLADNQSYYADLAEAWAENPEDDAVELGKYSALHHATKAAASEVTAVASASTATTKAAEASASALTAHQQATAAEAALSEAGGYASLAAGHASDAADSATLAGSLISQVSPVDQSGTSITSNYLAPTGYKTFVTQSGKSWTAGMIVRASYATIPSLYWMSGTVISYSGTSLVVSMDTVSGTGTYTNWILTTGYPASLYSPEFKGTPTAPTASAGTNTTQLATTAFVTTADNLKANIASPTFTGTPAAPTATAGTNTTQLATTAFVTTADNLKANLASPTFTGTPAAPTASVGTNTTQLATTAFVMANSSPVGTLIMWPTETPPTGFLECNGAAISRTTYSSLFSVLSTFYGSGDGSSTFNIPDMRGEFARGWAHGTSNDPDRDSRTNRGDGTTGDHIGTKQSSMYTAHNHSYVARLTGTSQMTSGTTYGNEVESLSTGSSGGTETRPRNVNVMFCIKY